MLNAIIALISKAFGDRLDAALRQETGERLTAFGRRVEAALKDGDVTPESLAAPAGAVADRPKRRGAA